MWADECYQLGYIVKTHGLKGEVIAQLEVDAPEEYAEMESVFLEQNGDLVPFFISNIYFNGSRATIKFRDIETINEAKEIVGIRLFLPLNLLPDLKEGQYYYHDLLGFDVYENDKIIGKIKSIYQPSSQFLASIEIKGKEVLVPIDDQIFIKVDLDNNRADVVLPEGLLNIYLNE